MGSHAVEIQSWAVLMLVVFLFLTTATPTWGRAERYRLVGFWGIEKEEVRGR